jgi:hypothetical protein
MSVSLTRRALLAGAAAFAAPLAAPAVARAQRGRAASVTAAI